MGDRTGEVEDLERKQTDTSSEPIKISYTAIKYITKNFLKVIGKGGFGEVYLGGLQNRMIAVKKLSQPKDFSNKQFLDEVTCLMKVQHKNIVRFLGYCADTQVEVMEVEGNHKFVEMPQSLLCLEYVPNGNLHHYLQEKTHGYEWSVRYQIIKGICEGLHYIHQKRIYHLDLKPANVLLGANMEPKITDFGLSRGYVPPEFIEKRQISLKSDIFSLGVIMINILTGGFTMENWHEAVDVDCGPQMKTCIIDIATKCIDKDPRKRPSTGEIIHSLNETETIDHASQTYKPKINEPQNDPMSSLHQIVQTFLASPAVNHQEQAARIDTLHMELDVPECLLEGSWKPGKIPYQVLLFTTSNFSRQQEISPGGRATVYKGILRRHRLIAVKRLMMTMQFNDQMFQNLIKIMMLAGQHKNIVQFLGYCYYSEGEAIEYQGELVMAETQERLLCFEYLRNGNLDHHISDASTGLEWRERYQIIKGICEGLHYLHGKHIVHMDLKPSHVLLDDNMVPKFSDFTLSRCFAEDQSQTITESILGAPGYMAPEFVDSGVVPFKSDIYSLGVTIKEILTGGEEYLDIEKVLESWEMRLGAPSLDTLLLKQVRVCAEISRACMADDPDKRPDTRRIIQILMGKETEAVPNRRLHVEQPSEKKIPTKLGRPYEPLLRLGDTLSPERDDLEVQNRPLLRLGDTLSTERDDIQLALQNLPLLTEHNTLYIEPDDLKGILEGSKKPGRLSYALLRLITQDFPDERLIGHGRFSRTYKGRLRGGIVAVKRLATSMHVVEFHDIIETMMLPPHRNIVYFVGYCSYPANEAMKREGKSIMDKGPGRLLCFEYLMNGSLHGHLSDASTGLEWRERYQIIKGICEGLHYLHGNHSVHLNLKPSKILLDDNLVPKITDFGLSRCFDPKKSRTTTSVVVGSRGYMAPEVLDGHTTLKSDIYSLGVIITEILTGRKDNLETEDVLESWRRTRLGTSSTDTLLEQVRVCAEISIACKDLDPAKRPDMQRVIEMLAETERNQCTFL